MSTPIIEIEHISKMYRIGALKEPYLSLRDQIAKKAKHACNLVLRKDNLRSSKEDFWALNDISFAIDEGEAFGIIGRNGAGKSTLLKILSRITPPTKGLITMRGRAASLLEVGTGFHPELSGRENIFLNGAILGMTRKEIQRKFDEIVAFSEIETFIDTPVKRYSSGMYVRLAFAVAAHLEPEILIVDEVLAVGDSAFQKKCLGKMGDVAKRGRTVLFVSHNMTAITQLCQKAVWLEKGAVRDIGNSRDIVNDYLSDNRIEKGEVDLTNWDDDRKGIGPLRIIRALAMDSHGKKQSIFDWGEMITIQACISTPDNKECVIAFSIRDRLGNIILHFTSQDTNSPFVVNPPNSLVSATFKNILNDGEYFVTIWLGDHSNSMNDRVGNCLQFGVKTLSGEPSSCSSIIKVFPEWRVQNKR